MSADISKFRVPLGSLVVDASLVVALIWWGATITERLEAMQARIVTVEQQRIQPEADRRISVLEVQLGSLQIQMSHANEKLDRLLERGAR